MSPSTEIEILLVEDNASDAELTLRALKKRNLANSIYHVTDGEEALNFIFAEGKYASRAGMSKPKVIFLDLKLPKVNGLEVLRKMKSDEKTRKIPIVALTSSKEGSDIDECYKLGVNSYIVKPVDFDKFTKAVSDLGFYWVALNQSP